MMVDTINFTTSTTTFNPTFSDLVEIFIKVSTKGGVVFSLTKVWPKISMLVPTTRTSPSRLATASKLMGH